MDCISISDDTSPRSTRSSLNPSVGRKSKKTSSVASLPITIDTDSTQRCPVTWESNRKERLTLNAPLSNNNVTPMSNHRVKLWLASTMHLQQTAGTASSHNVSFEPLDSGSNSSIVEEYFTRKRRYEESPKRNILIRHDFDKEDEIISVCSYNPRWQYNNGSNVLNRDGVRKDDEDDVCSNLDGDEKKGYLEEGNKKHKPKHQNNNEVPLSPETQKKNELCSYLQLMNMNSSDNKLASTIQNRRSTRVKNLMMMSEKKELERKLNNEAVEKDKTDCPKLNGEEKLKNLPTKSFTELNMCVHDDKSTKFMRIQDVPEVLLQTRCDFDEAMKKFMETENCRIKTDESGRNKSEKKAGGNNKKIVRKSKKYVKLKNLSNSPRLNPSLPYRTKLRNFTPNGSKNKQNQRMFTRNRSKSSFATVLVRNEKQKNLRSTLSLSKVGIKKLILDDKKKLGKRQSKIVFKQQRKSSKPRAMVKPTKTLNRKESQDGKVMMKQVNDSDDDVEIISLANLYRPKVQNMDDSTSHKDTTTDPTEKPNGRIETPEETEREVINVHEDRIDVDERKIIDLSNDSGTIYDECTDEIDFVEKSFNVIDLSHSKPDSLSDHDYTLKSPPDEGYIMNVILGAKEKSPVIESIESKSIDDDDDEFLNRSKEYCRETLEEIIGIPWRPAQKKERKTKEDASANKINEYDSFSLLTKSNNQNKMFNIRLPSLLEPPNNLFDEESRSPSLQADTTQHLDNASTDGSVDKPKIITIPVPSEVKNLHRSLIQGKRKSQSRGSDFYGESSNHTWDNENSCEDKRSHSIRITSNNGSVINAFYVDFNLAIVQEQSVSFWCQSALGNMLGSQDLWISKGSLQRLVLDNTCVFKQSSEMVISLDNSFAYVELWTKEHKSDKRERPLADVFATIYFWRQRQTAPNRKFLQLENINGKCSDVQYVVLRNSRSIVVSWVEIRDDMKKTVVHCYSLAADYQTVTNISEMDTVDHSVTSLHNIEDCNTMVMGFGEEQVTFWNIEYGYVVATIEIKSISGNPKCLWTKCDRGFLFILQYHQFERLLVLIAVNGITHSVKRLQVFRAPYGYDGLRGVCIDNNILAAFYSGGILCWNVQTGESVIEEMCSQTKYIPCDKHIVMLNADKIRVQQFLSYFLTSFDLQ